MKRIFPDPTGPPAEPEIKKTGKIPISWIVEAWLSSLAGQVRWPAGWEEWFLPWSISLAIAWMDVRTRRISNYLTLGGAAAGLGYQLGSHGLAGFADSLAGVTLGLILLLPFYLQGGLGAGDVKALAAMGAWLGFWRAGYLFFYMGISGGLLILVILWWGGGLRDTCGQGWTLLLNLMLGGPRKVSLPPPPASGKTVPYGIALALGMTILCWRWPHG